MIGSNYGNIQVWEGEKFVYYGDIMMGRRSDDKKLCI